MENDRLEQQKEIVFTYRQAEQAEPVQLRYERELPSLMQREDPVFPPRGAEIPDILWQNAIAPPEQSKKGRWGVRLFVGLSLLAALVCLGAGIWYVGQYGWVLPRDLPEEDSPQLPFQDGEQYRWDFDFEDAEAETTIARYPAGGAVRLSLASAEERTPLAPGEIYERVNPSVVTVVGRKSNLNSVGTGVILSEDGYIITNCHVIAGCSACKVWITGDYGAVSELNARLVGYDEDTDLAVLKVAAEDLPVAEFGVSDDLQVGDPVYAIGNPLGTELRNTFTNGIVSAVNRDVDVDGVTMTLIQTNAALNSGNSGGPLINQYGQVVGINTIKMMSEYDTIEGLGFAIPSSLAERWVNQLIELGELLPRPVLGITINREPRSLPDGSLAVVRVDSITPGGSGDSAGLRVGDYIVAFAGQDITSTEEILYIRRSLYVGDEVPIRIYRNGEFLDLMMVMMAESK